MPMPSFRDIRCIVFDLDDTLYLRRDYVRSGFEAIGRMTCDAFGNKCWELYEQGVRENTFDVARAYFEHVPLPETKILMDIYLDHRPNIQMCEDAQLYFRQFQWIPAAIITDGPLVSQQRKVEALGLDKVIASSSIIYTAATGYPKPHPDAFRRIERLYECFPEQCLYVADNPMKDFQAPYERGWFTYRIRRPQSLYYYEATPSYVHAESAQFPAFF